MDTLMTTKEAAVYLKLNYMTVYKLAQRGRIPASKVGGNWRFKRDVLDEWLTRKAATVEGNSVTGNVVMAVSGGGGDHGDGSDRRRSLQ